MAFFRANYFVKARPLTTGV